VSTIPLEDRTPEERAEAAAWRELTPRAQRAVRVFLALEEPERALLVGPHRRSYPAPVARALRQLDALGADEWPVFGRYVRTVNTCLTPTNQTNEAVIAIFDGIEEQM
jgi:hypothetical protein